VEKRGFRRGLSIGRGALMEEWRFRRELSTETGLFVEKLWLMMGLSIKKAVLVEEGEIADQAGKDWERKAKWIGGEVKKKCVGNMRNICEVGLYVE